MGRKADAETMAWWAKTNLGLFGTYISRKELDKPLLSQSLMELAGVIESLKEDETTPVIVWGNSARFDLGILAHAYQQNELPLPWQWRHEMCLRTLTLLHPLAKQGIQEPQVHHDPMHDSLYQVRIVQNLYKQLYSSQPNTPAL
jgi:hypothetical protein